VSETIDARGLRVNFEVTGSSRAPVVVLSHALGTDLGLWDPQAEAMAKTFRVLRYDTRGHGRTQVTPGPYSIDLLAGDLIALLDSLEIQRVHIAGVSLGGFIGQWVAANAPDRVDRLVLANTAARVGTASGWNTRIEAVRSHGISAIVQGSIERWFTKEFIAREPATIESTRRTLLATPVEGYTGCCAAIRDMDLRGLASSIRARTLVVTGTADESTPPADAEALARAIPKARCVTYTAAHLANVEARADFNRDIIRFLSSSEE
jgi:3-oxoadipate enol-lactonase